MNITWKNAPFIFLLICGIFGYVIRFEVLASDVKKNKEKIVADGKKIDVIFQLMCKDSIKKARTNKEKEEAINRCTIKQDT